MKREFLQLAHTLKGTEYIPNWFLSEKLDGMRCFWDGGITRGMYKSQVPWANTVKDSRYVTQPTCTGLWSRYGNIIHAPLSWLNKLPQCPLDGELYIPGYRQELMSIVKKLEPGFGWHRVKYYVFDVPPLDRVFADGEIRTTNYKKIFKDIIDWLKPRGGYMFSGDYKQTYKFLRDSVPVNKIVTIHEQNELPVGHHQAHAHVQMELDRVTDNGGEGLIIRCPHTYYECGRSHNILKVKKLEDDEGTVVGYISGRETDLGSKLLGMMGALILDYNGKRLELSGFTDQERMLNDPGWAYDNPGTEVPDHVYAEGFQRGDIITFRYRGKSKDGIPQEARYWRRREC